MADGWRLVVAEEEAGVWAKAELVVSIRYKVVSRKARKSFSSV